MNHAKFVNETLEEMRHEKMIATVGHQLLKGRPLTDAQFDYFFDHYCDTGAMPYGVAKGRTGDPYDWVDAKITEEYEAQCHGSNKGK